MLTHYTLLAPSDAPIVEEKELFIASNPQSLEDFLKTELSGGRHVYCSFSQSQLHWSLIKTLKQREIKSISFYDGQALLLN